jgi:hypothetical protein
MEIRNVYKTAVAEPEAKVALDECTLNWILKN